jgi:hypothetical protein
MARRTYHNNYTFVAATKKITFNDLTQLDLSRVSLITNVTRNVIIYNPNVVGFGGTVSTTILNELTLVFNTASQADNDVLLIAYENGDANIRVLNSQLSTVSYVNITSGGTGYTTAPAIAFVGNTSSIQPTAVAIVIDGSVVGIKVTNVGNSTVAPTSVTFTGGGGSGAVAAAPVSGRFNRHLVDGESNAIFQIYGTFGGTVVFEASIDGYNYFAVNSINPLTGAFSANTTVALNGEIEVSSFKYVQLRNSIYASGQILTNLKLSNATGLVGFNTPLPIGANTIGNVGGTVTANQGTANAAPWLANRFHPLATTIADAGVKTANFFGITQTNNNFLGILINVNVTAVAAGTLQYFLQFSPDSGTTWINFSTIISDSLGVVGTSTLLFYPSIPTYKGVNGISGTNLASFVLPKTWRISYQVTGSVTISSVQIQYIA